MPEARAREEVEVLPAGRESFLEVESKTGSGDGLELSLSHPPGKSARATSGAAWKTFSLGSRVRVKTEQFSADHSFMTMIESRRWSKLGPQSLGSRTTMQRNSEAMAVSVRSTTFQRMLLAVVLLDVASLIYELFFWATLVPVWVMVVVGGFYMTEVSLRLTFQGWVEFAGSVWNVADLLLCTISMLEAVSLAVDAIFKAETNLWVGDSMRYYLRLAWQSFRIARLVRALRVLRRWIGKSKRRFVDDKLDINIDLAYITPNTIAMSVPATGMAALYRNPITEVAKFFQERHAGKYLIFNICPELPYPTDIFEERVICFDVQDHAPPSMDDIFDFLEAAADWVYMSLPGKDEKDVPTGNIIAVHCRGGKGRTGTFICSWLMFSRHCRTLQDALRCFREKRTASGSKGKGQGVDSKGQLRILGYVEQFLKENHLYLPKSMSPLPRPPRTLARLHALRFRRLPLLGFAALRSGLRVDVRAPAWDNGPGKRICMLLVPMKDIVEDAAGVFEVPLGPDVYVERDFKVDVFLVRWVGLRVRRVARWLSREAREEKLSGWAEGEDAPRLRVLGSGAERGLWVCAHLHTAFLGPGPDYVMGATTLDATKLIKRRRDTVLNPAGQLELAFTVARGHVVC